MVRPDTESSPLSTSSSLSVVVVDDSAVFRLVLRDTIQAIPGCTVVGHAKNGRLALDVIERCQPDLVTLDVEMPEMDGISTLREIKRRRPQTRVLMVSRFTDSGAAVTTDALLEGAFDFVLKPSGRRPAENKAVLQAAMQEKIAALRESLAAADEQREPTAEELSADEVVADSQIDAVVIGTSTGGPDALVNIIPALSHQLPVPVVIVQHMPAGYTTRLAARLNERSELTVQEAADGDELVAGRVLLAPGGRQTGLLRREDDRVVVRVTDDPPEHGCQPAVDYLLRSAVDVYSGHLLAVILTGMGRDGTEGCRLVRSQNGRVLAQHQQDCTVFGMPGSVIRSGQVDRVVRLKYMAAVIRQEVQR